MDTHCVPVFHFFLCSGSILAGLLMKHVTQAYCRLSDTATACFSNNENFNSVQFSELQLILPLHIHSRQ
jgi:hypothetical protein